MKRLRITICLAALLAIAASTHAEDFNLAGTEHLDVTTTYENGNLRNSSTANILTGANINNRLTAYDNSTVNVSGGYVDQLYAFRSNSTVNISSGNVNILSASYNSSLNISGGNIDSIWARNNSTVDISGGNANVLTAYNLRLNGPKRINITNGTVTHLHSWIALQGSEHLNYTADLSLSDLASYGLQAAQETIDNLYVNLSTSDDSSLSISDGSVRALQAYNNSTMNVSGGSINSLYTGDNSNINISGGSLDWLNARNSSNTNISNGSIDRLDVRGSSSLNISGGSFNGLDAFETSTIIFEGYDFSLGSGLSWDIDNQTILGTGTLTGKWFGETEIWSLEVYRNDPTATITAIPEPATLLLLTLGTFAIIKKRKT